MSLSTIRIISSQPSEAKSLFVAIFLFRCCTIAFPFYGAFLIAQRTLAAADAAFVVGAFGVGALTADLVSSAILHRLRADLVIKLSIFLLACLVMAISWAHSITSLVALTFAWGVCYEAVTPASYALITDIYRGRDNKMAFACNRLAINMGMAIGPLLGGLLYALAPHGIFLGNCVAFALIALLLVRYLPKSTHGSPAEEVDRPALDAHGGVRSSNIRFFFAFAVTIPLHIAFALPPTMISVLVIDKLQQSPMLVSAIFLLNTFMVIALEVPLNAYFLRWRASSALVLAFVISGAGFISMGMATWPVWLLAATALWTFGEMTIFPTFLAYIDSISPRRFVKRNMGLYSAGVSGGVLIAPPLALAITQISGGLPWVMSGAALIASGCILFLTRRVRVLWLDAAETQSTTLDDSPQHDRGRQPSASAP